LFPTAAEMDAYMQSDDYDAVPTTKDTRTLYAAVVVDATGVYMSPLNSLPICTHLYSCW
jgi:hypothetical protein